ncbi:MAG TPA: NAD-dependent DNA ligase LigA [Opitutaceae bacterium]|nr:NAD-dependent DNA ligase LigA [Opitutaceae bacterium]
MNSPYGTRWLAVCIVVAALAAIGGADVPVASVIGNASQDTALNDDSAHERILWLRAEIARHDDLYFKKAAPEISDAAYDALKRELVVLEQAHPEFAQNSVLGDDRSGRFLTYRHRVRMLGLDKSYTEAELRTFHGRHEKQLNHADLVYVVEPKYDGVAISVTYENGRLVRAVTRGNGTEGDDVTANVRTIRSLATELRATDTDGSANPIPDIVELRGEIYVSFAEFGRINRDQEEQGSEPFAHPRNLAAGTLKLTNPEEVAQRKLEIVFYGWGAWESAQGEPASQRELHTLIRAWGLPGLEHIKLASGADELWMAVQALGRERSRFGFPTDGAVVKLDAADLWEALGASDQSSRWAVAFKFAPARVRTQVRSITLQVGRTGVLTPVAELEPVVLGGSTVSRALLHNREWIAQHDIRVDDAVFLEKAGEIIPQLAGVDTAARPATSKPYEFPSECPECRTPVESLTGEAAVRCSNHSCPAQVRRRVEHFASKACVDIDGLGPAMVEKLVAKGWVKDIADLYRLRREDLLTLGGNVDKSTDRLLAAIERSKRVELWRFINGLGIPRVGAAKAKQLAAKFGSLEALAAVRAVDPTAGIDSAAAESVLEFLSDPRNRMMVKDLVRLGVEPKKQSAASPD